MRVFNAGNSSHIYAEQSRQEAEGQKDRRNYRKDIEVTVQSIRNNVGKLILNDLRPFANGIKILNIAEQMSEIFLQMSLVPAIQP